MPGRAESPKSSTGAWLLLGLLAIATTVVIGGLMQVRFDSGEHYPHYSTLRVDPLGTRAFYEALGRTPGVKVERNFQKLDRLEGRAGTTLVMCGMDARQFATRDFADADAVSRFVVSGGRLVIALNPDISMDRINRAIRDAEEEHVKERGARRDKEASSKTKKEPGSTPKADISPAPAPPVSPKKPEAKTDDPKDKGSPKKKAKGKAAPTPAPDFEPSFAETIKVTAKSKEFFYFGKEGSPLALTPDLPLQSSEVPGWRSNVYLDTSPKQDWEGDWRLLSGDADRKKPSETTTKATAALSTEPSPWKTLATKGDRVMIAERPLGSGKVVVCTDRYFLSNEALWTEAKPAFLSWLVGDASTILFDETHLGAYIGDEDGIMTLARRYRMHGLFLGGILLFALFIWRNALSLVPPTAEDDLGLWRADAVAGRSAASGLEGLLRRGIAPGRLLQRCFEVWEGSRAAVAAVSADRLAKAKVLLSDPQAFKRPIATYRALRDTLHTARHQRPHS